MPPKRVLLDHNLPRQLAAQLAGFDVRTAYRMGWARLVNGQLLAQAEAAGFEVLVTADQSLGYQQNLAARTIAIVVLSTNSRRVLEGNINRIQEAITAAAPASFAEIECLA